MTDDRERWALILGASSGMGEATGLALARSGYRIAGIHLEAHRRAKTLSAHGTVRAVVWNVEPPFRGE